MSEREPKRIQPEQPQQSPDSKETRASVEESLPASAAAIVDERGRVLLMKRVSFKPGHGEDWVYPGGAAEPGESPLAALIREVEEEAGIRLDPTEHKVFPIANYITAPDAYNQTHDLSIYVAQYSSDQPQPSVASPSEMTDFGWFYPDEVLGMVARGEMNILPSGQYAIRRIKEYLSDEKVLAYGEVLMGGTFDRLHDGHKRLLQRAYEVGDYVYIGLTTDRYIEGSKKKLKEMVNTFETRLANLRAYLHSQGVLERTIILPLDDVAGPKAMDGKLGAIVLSEETTSGGDIINERRKGVGVQPMDVVVVNLLRDQDNEVLSSTRLREQEHQGGESE